MSRPLLERDIERYLVKQAKARKGVVRKVQWVGLKNAPDRVVMLPERAADQRATGGFVPKPPGRHWRPARTVWVELKNPETILTFPANAHERAQHREHERMRAVGQRVEVIGTYQQVDNLLI